MGLDCTHDAFSGSYGSFNRLRKVVARAAKGAYPDFTPEEIAFLKAEGIESPDSSQWYWGDDYSKETHAGLHAFFCHSDCGDGFSPDMCLKVAEDIERLLPGIDAAGIGGGHIERDGGYGAVARRFIAGCRRASAAGEPLEFR